MGAARKRWLRLALAPVAVFAFVAPLAVPAGAVAEGSCPNEALREEQGMTALPDCRAWELVSPQDKGGNDVMVDTGRVRAERSGSPMALMFPSLGGFGETHGTGNAEDFVSERTLTPGTQGWATHGVTAPQDSLAYTDNFNGQDPLYVGDATPDLSKAVFSAFSPLGDAPNVEALSNLYLRSDLRSPGLGTYSLLSDAFAPTPLDSSYGHSGPQLPDLVGASSDLTHVLFESIYQLTPNAPASDAEPKLYENVDGVVRYVGILPAAEGGGPAPRAIAGQDYGSTQPGIYTPHVISEDGSRVIFTVPTASGEISGRIYERDDMGTPDTADDVTVWLNAPEVPPGTDTEQPATYWDASSDGRRIFFTSHEQLTPDAIGLGGVKLYMYDASKPPGDAHNLTLVSQRPMSEPADVFGTLGVSSDGSIAYFVASGDLLGGGPSLGSGYGIYAWQQGVGVRYVGQLLDDSTDPREDVGGGSHFYTVRHQLGARVTPDGLHLLFSARQPPRPGIADHGDCPQEDGYPFDGKVGCRELYLYTLGASAPTCVSCSPSGVPPTTPAFFSTAVNDSNASTTWHLNSPITEDGGRVFFTTGEALLPADKNGHVDDVYEYDAGDGSLHLISGGTGTDNSYFLDATPNGNDVFIATRDRLTKWDVDDNVDVYDVRVDGGVQDPPSVPVCSGEVCQGALTGPPNAQSFGSSLLITGNGNGVPVTSSKASKHLSKAQKLRKALRACRSKHGKAKRKKCESAARRRFGKSGGSK